MPPATGTCRRQLVHAAGNWYMPPATDTCRRQLGEPPVTTRQEAPGMSQSGIVARRREAALAGHGGDEPVARRSLLDGAPSVRATALGALARMGRLGLVDVQAAMGDSQPEVR